MSSENRCHTVFNRFPLSLPRTFYCVNWDRAKEKRASTREMNIGRRTAAVVGGFWIWNRRGLGGSTGGGWHGYSEWWCKCWRRGDVEMLEDGKRKRNTECVAVIPPQQPYITRANNPPPPPPVSRSGLAVRRQDGMRMTLRLSFLFQSCGLIYEHCLVTLPPLAINETL